MFNGIKKIIYYTKVALSELKCLGNQTQQSSACSANIGAARRMKTLCIMMQQADKMG